VAAAPLIVLISGTWGTPLALVAYFALSLLLGAYCSTAFAAVTALFPTPIRYSGISITVNLASPIFGSTAPLIAAALTEALGVPLGFKCFSAYFLALWIMALIAVSRTDSKAFKAWGRS
jgi:MHS family proline/betaine transporter-like MFS transporter